MHKTQNMLCYMHNRPISKWSMIRDGLAYMYKLTFSTTHLEMTIQ